DSGADTGSTGRGGIVTVTATEAISITGRNSGLFSRTMGPLDAGRIMVSTPQLTMLDGGTISTATQGAGQAGDITLNIGTLVARKATRTRGSPGTVWGTAGTVTIKGRGGPGTPATRLTFMGSAVTTEAAVADGGDIQVVAQDTLRLRDSQITTAVGSGEGRGGNIVLDPTFVVLERSRIVADAFGGPGGNIRIVAQGFLIDANSRLSA